MTITPTQGPAGTPNDWVLRRSDPGGEEFMPGEDTTAGESGLGFGDLLDAINPLQHLPIVGTLYRALTGDTISETARMAGGALYGGPAGLVGALANLMVEKETGSDIGGTALAWVTDEPAAGDAGTAVAGAVAGADPALPGLPQPLPGSRRTPRTRVPRCSPVVRPTDSTRSSDRRTRSAGPTRWQHGRRPRPPIRPAFRRRR